MDNTFSTGLSLSLSAYRGIQKGRKEWNQHQPIGHKPAAWVVSLLKPVGDFFLCVKTTAIWDVIFSWYFFFAFIYSLLCGTHECIGCHWWWIPGSIHACSWSWGTLVPLTCISMDSSLSKKPFPSIRSWNSKIELSSTKRQLLAHVMQDLKLNPIFIANIYR